MKSKPVLGAALALWLAAMPICAAETKPAAQSETEYLAVFIGGKKAGHGSRTRTVSGQKVAVSEHLEVTIERMGTPITVQQTSTSTETPDGRPLAFEVRQQTAGLDVHIQGTIDDRGQATATTTAGGSSQTKPFEWPAGALLTEGARLMGLKKGLRKGTKYTLKLFEPTSLRATDAQVEVGETQDVDLLGRVVKLTEATVTLQGPTGKLVTTSYVDDRFEARKVVMSMLGQQLEMIACTRAFARSKNDVIDFFDTLTLDSPVSLKGLDATKTITYHLRATDKRDLRIPTFANQTVRKADDGTIVVTVRPAQGPSGASFPYKGDDKHAQAATRPTKFLQSTDQKVKALARQAVGQTKDAAQAVAKIEAFVHKYIRQKDLSVGYASAAEVAARPQGDCSEHAVLATAMCRALGIPAQVVVGLAYAPQLGKRSDVFGPHAWCRAYVGDRWVPFDATHKGSDARRITLGVGDGSPEEFLGVVTTLGYFKIEKIVIGD